MAHEFESGFSVKEVPWHGLGTVLDNPPTIAEALEAAGLNWGVDITQCEARMPDGQLRMVPDAYIVYRTDTMEPLGQVGGRYCPVDNTDALSVLDPIVSSGQATLETAYSLRGGRRIVIQARLGEPIAVSKGDEVVPYLFVASSHDGTLALTVAPSATRIVCNNTLSIALRAADAAGGRGGKTSIRHTKRAGDKLKLAGQVLAQAKASFAERMELFKKLARVQLPVDGYARAVAQALKPVAPLPAKPSKEQEESHEKAMEGQTSLLDAIMESYERGPSVSSARGTAWGAYNAVTHWATHVQTARKDGSTRNAEAAFEQLILGQGANGDRLEQALQIAVLMADGRTEHHTVSSAVKLGVDPKQAERAAGKALVSDWLAG